MEIYRNTSQNVYLDIIGASADEAPSATVSQNYAPSAPLTVTGPSTLEDGTERWSAYIPLSATQTDTTLSVSWDFAVGGEEATKTDIFDVVTPYATMQDFADFSDDVISEAKFKRAERKVRHVIDTFTGQNFGQYRGALRVFGRGDSQLILPRPLLEINSVDDGVRSLAGGIYGVYGDGFFLGIGENRGDGDWVFTNVIRDPSEYFRRPFLDNVAYTIDGVWGYRSVPSEINQAALILIEQALCPDSVYRDRQLKSVRAADWRLEYAPGAFRGTGSLEADALLESYRRYQMTVI